MSARGTLRVGLLVAGALLVLMAGVFLIGQQNRLFAHKNRYTFTAASAAGLNQGNPVRLNGVIVGLVENIYLPRDARQQLLTVKISIESRYEERIRGNSVARIRTMGLLGDKYVDVTSGSPAAPMIPPGGRIPTAAANDVDRLLASGGDVVDNMVRISYSLSRILARIDRGEGLVGELTTKPSESISQRLDATLASFQRVMDEVEHGKGALGRMVGDEKLGDELATAVTRLEVVMSEADRGDGLLPALLRDANTKADFQSTLADLRQSGTALQQWTARVEHSDSVANQLLTDEQTGRQVGGDLRSLVHSLASAAAKLDRGNGSAAKLINDPQIYDAVNDIIIGVKDSKLLRWLIRSRQQKGIASRYNAAVRAQGLNPATAADEVSPAAPAPGANPTPGGAPSAGAATAEPPAPSPTPPPAAAAESPHPE